LPQHVKGLGDAQPYHYYLAHLHSSPKKARILRLSRSHWNIERYLQRGKTDPGLDHYEGCCWRGFHHHLVLAALDYLFVTIVCLRAKKHFWCDAGTDTEEDAAVVATVDRLLPLLRMTIQ
jgi:SRSO17 transposase